MPTDIYALQKNQEKTFPYQHPNRGVPKIGSTTWVSDWVKYFDLNFITCHNDPIGGRVVGFQEGN